MGNSVYKLNKFSRLEEVIDEEKKYHNMSWFQKLFKDFVSKFSEKALLEINLSPEELDKLSRNNNSSPLEALSRLKQINMRIAKAGGGVPNKEYIMDLDHNISFLFNKESLTGLDLPSKRCVLEYFTSEFVRVLKGNSKYFTASYINGSVELFFEKLLTEMREIPYSRGSDTADYKDILGIIKEYLANSAKEEQSLNRLSGLFREHLKDMKDIYLKKKRAEEKDKLT